MEVIIRESREKGIDIATEIVTKHLRERESPVIGLATGSTPERLYQRLIEAHRRGAISFRKCTTFNLDEYAGLSCDHPQSYYLYMHEKLFRHIDIRPENIHIPNGNAPDLRRECRDYELRINKAGPIDLQILGIGSNGHIGFNEPFGSLSSRTWVKILSRKTIEENSRFFEDIDGVPKHVITMGIATILQAEHCLVLAFGESKAQAVYEMIEGPVTAKSPASALQLHQRTTIITDEEAASKLQHRLDFKWVEQNKLEWQRYENSATQGRL